jgi:hypothetical protein
LFQQLEIKNNQAIKIAPGVEEAVGEGVVDFSVITGGHKEPAKGGVWMAAQVQRV